MSSILNRLDVRYCVTSKKKNMSKTYMDLKLGNVITAAATDEEIQLSQ